jgi:hypothetical protein
MLAHYYIESIGTPRRGAVNGYPEANNLNMHKSDGFVVNPLLAQIRRADSSRT